MSKFFRLGAVISILACGHGFAQTGGDGGAPAVRLEPGKAAHWSIRVRTEKPEEEKGESPGGEGAEEGGGIAVDGGADAEKPKVTRSEYLVTGNTGRAVTKGDDEKRVEIYMFRHQNDTLLFTWSKSARRVVPYLLDQYVGPEMRFSRRYPGIDWVRPSDYRGVVEFGGRKCHYYSMAPNVPDPKVRAARADALAYDPRLATATREAWFDLDTGLPVSFRDGDSKGSYRHYDAPAEALELPEAYAAALRYYYGAGARPDAMSDPPITAPDPHGEETEGEGDGGE